MTDRNRPGLPHSPKDLEHRIMRRSRMTDGWAKAARTKKRSELRVIIDEAVAKAMKK